MDHRASAVPDPDASDTVRAALREAARAQRVEVHGPLWTLAMTGWLRADAGATDADQKRDPGALR